MIQLTSMKSKYPPSQSYVRYMIDKVRKIMKANLGQTTLKMIGEQREQTVGL